MQIKLFSNDMVSDVSKMIERSIKNSLFATFYPQSIIDSTINDTTEQKLIQDSINAHFYVIEDDGAIVACGGIKPYAKDESLLYNIFVDPSKHGKGYGKIIINTLENDEYFKSVSKTRVRAAVSAIPFYRKMGFCFKNGEIVCENGRFIMEKYNKNV